MVSPTFNPENPKYKCCFGKIHVKTATKWIFYYEFILSLLLAGYLGFTDPDYPWKDIPIFVSLFAFVFVSGIQAVEKEISNWFIPYFFEFILNTVLNVYSIGCDLVKRDYELGWLLYSIFSLVSGIWFATIIFACYQYFNEKKQSFVLPISFTNKNIETFVLEENI